MEWLVLVPLFAALARRNGGAQEESRSEPAPAPSPATARRDAFDEVKDAATKVGGAAALVGGAAKVGKTVLAQFAAGAAAVGGFALVVGLWAVAFIASQVASRVLEPEINRRRTLPAWLTGDVWGFAWRGSREFWLTALESRPEAAGLIRLVYRWADGDGRYGDLNVQGELVYLSRVDEGAPGDRFAFYEAIAWAKSRNASPQLQAATDAAHALARAWGRAFIATAAGLAELSGQRDSSTPLPQLASLQPEGAPTSTTSEPSSSGYSVQDLLSAVMAGSAAATGLARASYAESGEWLFQNVSKAQAAAVVATRLRESGFVQARAEGGRVWFGSAWADMPGGLA